MARQRVSLAPLLGVNSRRVSDRALQGTFMRGGYNVELRDGEWWTRMGEVSLGAKHVRLGSCPWWWVVRVNDALTVIANPWWALALDQTNGVNELYTAAVTENVAVTNGSANVTTTSTRTVDQLILMGAGATGEVYRVKSRVGTAAVLDRPYEGSTNAAKSCRFIDPLARNVAGTATAYTAAITNVGAYWIRGSCVVFEQLVSHTATDLYAASPTLTGGNLHLVITSNVGVPVAIDLSAYIAGSTVGVRRTWFYNTALGSAATQIGTDTISGNTYARGIYAEVYKGRLFIGAATDPNGKYGSRTIWYSQPGDLGRWHTGIAAQTAAPNFITFDGEGDEIADLKILQESLVVHRKDSQEVGNITGSSAQPFQFRSNNQGFGIGYYGQVNSVVVANGAHYAWSRRGPVVFDGNTMSTIAEDARDALRSLFMADSALPILSAIHDPQRGRIYWYSYPSVTSRIPDALPAVSTISLKSGESVQDYVTCFVLDYLNGAWWFEHRPQICGGGSTTLTVAGLAGDGPVFSRLDGTLVAPVSSSSDGKDSDYLAPTTSGSRVPVYAQVETPWLDFGNLSAKKLTEVELTFRGLADGESVAEEFATFTGTPWLRMRVYGDKNRNTALGDVGVVYDPTGTQITTKVDFAQSPTGLLTFTPRSRDLRQVKFVFSNGLTSAATTAGYSVLPFRISDIEVEYTQRESTIPLTTLTSASISE